MLSRRCLWVSFCFVSLLGRFIILPRCCIGVPIVRGSIYFLSCLLPVSVDNCFEYLLLRFYMQMVCCRAWVICVGFFLHVGRTGLSNQDHIRACP